MVYSLQCLIHLHPSHAALDQPQQDVLRLCPLGCDTTRHWVLSTHIAFVVAEGEVTRDSASPDAPKQPEASLR